MSRKLGFELIAPGGSNGRPSPWEGRTARKPWEYHVTVVIPHLNTPEPLPTIVDLLRLQTVRPYIMVVDTGSSPQARAQLENLRDDDVEVHYIFAHGYRHASEPVCVAQDLGLALCRTNYLFNTHADVFLRRQDFLAWLMDRCDEKTPVVGYELSERSWITEDWRGMVSHTATMLYMPFILKHGISWSYQRIHHGYNYPWMIGPGWPDTEVGFNRGVREAGVTPLLIGHDVNYARQVDDNIDHVRSYSGSKMYGSQYFEKAKVWMAEAISEGQKRALAWRHGTATP